jgi:hypothetical protein
MRVLRRLLQRQGYFTRRTQRGARKCLPKGVNAINRTNGYIGGVYGVMLEVSKAKVWLALSKFDLSHCFEQAAKRDWAGALAAAQSIQSKALRSQAYIAACRTVL